MSADRDENENLVDAELDAIESAALDSDPAADADELRDAWWLRWLKFIAVIIVPAVILGLGFLFGYYFLAGRIGSSYQMQHDTIGLMKFRFWLGASIGGGLGMIYVVRCIIRRADP